MNRKLLKKTLIITFVSAVIEICYTLNGSNNISLIIFGLFAEIVYVMGLIKSKLLFSPHIFADFFTICLYLYQLKMIVSYKELPPNAILCILLCVFLWRVINTYDSNSLNKLNISKGFDLNINRVKSLKYITMLFLISCIFMFFEWYKAGGIPALRSDSETFRFTVKINGITHMFAIMNKVVAIIAVSYLICRGKKSKNDYIYYIIFVTSSVLMYLTAMRGELTVILFVILVLIFNKYNIKLSKLILCSIPILLFLSIVPIIRKYGLYGSLYIKDQMAISTYPKLWYLSPLYQTLCDSIGVFGTVTEMFPSHYSFGIIEYSVLPQIPFIDLGRNVSAEIGKFLNSSFYSGLTSTYLGTCYADGGILGACIYTIFMAVWSRIVYIKYVTKRNFKYLILYAFMFYNILMLSYGNTIIELSFVFYYIIISIMTKMIDKK